MVSDVVAVKAGKTGILSGCDLSADGEGLIAFMTWPHLTMHTVPDHRKAASGILSTTAATAVRIQILLSQMNAIL